MALTYASYCPGFPPRTAEVQTAGAVMNEKRPTGGSDVFGFVYVLFCCVFVRAYVRTVKGREVKEETAAVSWAGWLVD